MVNLVFPFHDVFLSFIFFIMNKREPLTTILLVFYFRPRCKQPTCSKLKVKSDHRSELFHTYTSH